MGCCGNHNQRANRTQTVSTGSAVSVTYTPKTIAKGAIGLTKVALGIGKTDDETITTRRNICRTCPEATRNDNPKFEQNKGLTTFSQCKLCLCWIAAKTKFKDEQCPAGKW